MTDPSYAAWEAAGLAWLAQAHGDPATGLGMSGLRAADHGRAGRGRADPGRADPGRADPGRVDEAPELDRLRRSRGARVVQVLEVGAEGLVLERLVTRAGGPSSADAEEFGRALAATHAAGADAFGWAPVSEGADGWLGPADDPLPLPCRPTTTWGPFFAEQRILHTVHLGLERGVFTSTARIFEQVAARVSGGEFDGERADLAPARLHGDLWSGNVMWTDDGAVLIDPAAHGGHRETDLAMLALFGAPHLDRIVAAYDEVSPLTQGWRDRVALHQLHPVMLHAVLFGGGYERQAVATAERFS